MLGSVTRVLCEMMYLMFTSVAALCHCLMLHPDVQLFFLCTEIGARLQQYACSQLSFSFLMNIIKTQKESAGV